MKKTATFEANFSQKYQKETISCRLQSIIINF